MANPRERMLRLLSLLQSGRHWSAVELAAAMEATPRTLRRDIEHLRDQGYPVVSTRGPGGHYRLVAGAALPPLMLDDDEAIASVLGLRLVTAGGAGVDIQSDAADRAIAKLRRILPTPLRRKTDQVLAAIDIDATRHPQPSSDVVRRLAEAITTHTSVTFDHAHGGRSSSRTVEPYRIVRARGRWYLFCWDTLRDDWRSFRLDRITSPLSSNAAFPPRPLPADDVAGYVTEQFGGPAQLRVVLTLHTDARDAASRLHRIDGSIEPIDGTRCRYTAHVDSFTWLATVLVLSGLDFTIEESDEFGNYIADAGHRLLAAVADR
ncbi:putative DNA-binding transcriptional regulator YafY [Rhodococcus sp. OK519]|uniref:helix-turn-helix transcriptional regulator n=1 Tax=Rhodococcus sp. OK519 TaxID=2135729 RepID=UPI000D4B3505|nr:putative DNA-binding transcriptional regulator YafY [Rhodococcus sp. OK519]